MAEHKHAAVLRAIADKGFEAGEWQHSFGDWREAHDFLNPLTHPQLEWRIKPEPKPAVVRYWPVRLTGDLKTLEEARQYFPGNQAVIKLTFDGETGQCRTEVLQ